MKLDCIESFPNYLRKSIFFFILALTFGYFSGFKFIVHTTDLNAQGISENYTGNEYDESANVLKFKRSEGEMLTTIHTHVLSFSLIFFCLGALLVTVPINIKLKYFLMVEPFVSTILTFGGIWLLWLGYDWVKYIVMVSGILITLSFTLSAVIIAYYCLKKEH
ncbi:MAG TPA: hypothetical protein PKL31_08895 [Fulvivirga sp.]|nr:hypothetical protein [Fulvivirga sp.]